MSARGARLVLVAAALLAGGCQEDDEVPRSFIGGPRVLAIKAEPPEVAPGQSSTVTILLAGTEGQTPAVSWSACLLPPLPGQASNPD
jgi:hypothetical protein